MSTTGTCPRCGTYLYDDDRFCPKCGAQAGGAWVPLSAARPRRRPTHERLLFITLIVAVIALGAVAVSVAAGRDAPAVVATPTTGAAKQSAPAVSQVSADSEACELMPLHTAPVAAAISDVVGRTRPVADLPPIL